MKLPISVIIPVYNVAPYLRQCVDSVLNQTYQRFEIILVDDGSTDGSPGICDEYAASDSRIRYIHKENGGASSARNVGLDEAKGEYIYFLDSDDIIAPEAFQVLHDLASGEKADIVFFEADTFSDEGKAKSGHYGYCQHYQTQKGSTLLAQLIEHKEFHVSIPLLFIRNHFLKDSGIRLIEGIMYEDMVFTFELVSVASVVAHCNRVLYHRRYRKASVTTAPKRLYNFTSAETVCYELLRYMNSQGLCDSEMAIRHFSRCAMNCLNLYTELPRDAKIQCRKKKRLLVKTILQYHAFGSKALYARCYGKFPWLIVKCLEKIGLK